MIKNKAIQHLASIPPKILSVSDLTVKTKAKVQETTMYAMEHNDETDVKLVLSRCIIAILAEQYVAEHMNGAVMHGEETPDDPWTYAFDVVSGPEYYGQRIEVKTHQSDSKYITVKTMTTSESGINLVPFLESNIADLIIIFDTTEIERHKWLFTARVIADQLGIQQIITKSNFSGHYLNTYLKPYVKENFNIFCYN